MPYFKWYGIDLAGKLCSGVMMTRTEQELSALLHHDDIALLHCKTKKPLPIIQTVSLEMSVTFFRQLSLLLRSGIFLDQALSLVSHQLKKRFFNDIVHDVLTDIRHGVSLSHALSNYPTVFDNVTVQMVQAGQESGKLVEALDQLCTYQETIVQFRKKLYATLLMPAITFIFFIILALIIFVIIVPTFSSMFDSVGQQISTSTAFIIAVSDFIRSWKIFLSFLAIIVGAIGIRYGIRMSKKMQHGTEYCLLALPLIGDVVKNITFVYFFQSLALLTQTGVHLVTALALARDTIGITILKNKISLLCEAIEQGNSLSGALQNHHDLFSEYVVAMLAVGQESGCLPFIFNQVSLVYKEQINRILTIIATLIQPLLMVILGLLITMLICALYVPLFNLSSVIS